MLNDDFRGIKAALAWRYQQADMIILPQIESTEWTNKKIVKEKKRKL